MSNRCKQRGEGVYREVRTGKDVHYKSAGQWHYLYLYVQDAPRPVFIKRSSLFTGYPAAGLRWLAEARHESAFRNMCHGGPYLK